MEQTKIRKTDENGGLLTAAVSNDSVNPLQNLTPEDAHKVLQCFTKEQILDLLQDVVVRDAAVLDAVRSIADSDPTKRKLLVQGIGWETTTEKLRSIFSAFGELDEAIVITDKTTGKSKGYGFVTYKHIDGAVLALKEPSKMIDGRITVAQLAVDVDVDVSIRKIHGGQCPIHFRDLTLGTFERREEGDEEDGQAKFVQEHGDEYSVR